MRKSSGFDYEIAFTNEQAQEGIEGLGVLFGDRVACVGVEFPANGNLERAARGTNQQLLWEMKLKIATQVAHAVSYLDHGLSKMFIRRVKKTGSIFLDKDRAAKHSDFQTCLPIPEGETHVEVHAAIGTCRLLAPELHGNPHYTEKNDVSFSLELYCLTS